MDKVLRLALIQLIMDNQQLTNDMKYDAIAIIPRCSYDDEAKLFAFQLIIPHSSDEVDTTIHDEVINTCVFPTDNTGNPTNGYHQYS